MIQILDSFPAISGITILVIEDNSGQKRNAIIDGQKYQTVTAYDTNRAAGIIGEGNFIGKTLEWAD